MRDEYDFSKARPNPYAKRLKQAVTIRLDKPTVDYFKLLADKTVIPYQTLINLYLRDCVLNRREINASWRRAQGADSSKKRVSTRPASKRAS